MTPMARVIIARIGSNSLPNLAYPTRTGNDAFVGTLLIGRFPGGRTQAHGLGEQDHQIGVFASYVSRHGHAFIGRALLVKGKERKGRTTPLA
jgi:hypothetical protein